MRRAAGAALLGAMMALVAVLFDTASLWVPAVSLLLLSLGAAGWVALAASGAGIMRAPGPPTVEEEQPYPLLLELRPGLLPPPGGELRDPLLAEAVPLGGRAPRRVRIDVRFSRRGKRVLDTGSLTIRDPLRLAVRELPGGGEAAELLVLPRVEPVVLAGPGSGGAGAGAAPDGGGGRPTLRGRMDGSAAELDLDGLRPYREGTPATRIHWPAVARSGEMLERRLTADADSSPLVVLDATLPPTPEALDMAVRAAASLCVHLARREGCALLLPGDRRPVALAPDLGAWAAVHARLALVGPSGSRPPLARARRAGAVIWVSARMDAPRELLRGAGGGGWLVTPAASAPPGTPVAFTVAGCAGRRLGRATRATAGRAA